MIFLESILSAILSSVLISSTGYYAEKFRITTLSFCVAHAALAGASIGLVLRADPTYSGMVLAVTSAILLGVVLPRIHLKEVLTLSLFSFFSAIALIAIYLSNTTVLATTTLSMVLWGSLLAVDVQKLVMLSVALTAFAFYLKVFKVQIDSIIFDRELAEAEGIDVYSHTLALLAFMGVAIALALRITGGFLIFALLYIPVASSLLVADTAKGQLLASITFASLSAIFGFSVSYVFDLPIGSSITIVAATILLISAAISRRGSVVYE
ncbi:MAG TPA: metal ABC transporter permease [Archaeoglobus veneficus]|nr:MAG: hypothetical protein DRO98_05795 [Archaeoglobales archaeon]HDM60107.1 metal ABC transporter permease [Archaeoglobus veneficus]